MSVLRRFPVTLQGFYAMPLLLAACSPHAHDSQKSDVVKVVPAAQRPAPRAAPSPIPRPTPTVAQPIRMTPRKTFTDPPLPPELRDDGGLTPLPPPPPKP
ncbi:hypothetical protein [Sphingomonas sp. Leaf357]|uniref:hypothetical protein n=1 Tax=Sphingomonas sp. Leaf357 TaxID=1736350 RepID=UPI000AA927C1|nr:hypothetical protein [Sphingomonas sp. Leaf357]